MRRMSSSNSRQLSVADCARYAAREARDEGRQSSYAGPDRDKVASNGIPLNPGMTVTAEIKTDSRRVID